MGALSRRGAAAAAALGLALAGGAAAVDFPVAIFISNWPSWRYTPDYSLSALRRYTEDLNGIYVRIDTQSGIPLYSGQGGLIESFQTSGGLRGYRFRIAKPDAYGTRWNVVAKTAAYSNGPIVAGEYAQWRKLTDYGVNTYYPSALAAPRAAEICPVNRQRPDPKAETCEPIDTIGGQLVLEETDLALPCPGPDLVLVRSYGSGMDYTAGPLGPRWIHSWEWSLAEITADYLRVRTAAGQSGWLEKGADGRWRNGRENAWWAEGPDAEGYRLHVEGGRVLRFDSQGRFLSVADPQANTVRVTRSGGLPVRLTHSNGQFLEFSYQGGRLAEVRTPVEGFGVRYEYTPGGDLAAAVRSGAGGETRTAYGYREGRLAARTNANHEAFAYAYAADGRCVGLAVEEECWAHTVAYDPGGAAAEVRYERDATHAAVYRYRWRPDMLKVTDIEAGGVTNRYEYDAISFSLTREETREGGGWEEAVRQVDARHRLTNETFGCNAAARDPWRYAWEDAFDAPVSAEDPEGHRTEFGSVSGLVVSVRQYPAPGRCEETRLGYTAGGLLAAVTNAAGDWVRLEYDGWGFLSAVVPEAGPALGCEFDRLGNLRRVAMPGGRVSEFESDELGRVGRIVHPDGREERFGYDALGSLTNHVDRAGRRTRLRYRPTGRLESVSREESGTNLTVVSFAYDRQFHTVAVRDAAGRTVESCSLDGRDRPVEVRDLEGRTAAVRYAAGDRLSWIRRFDGTEASFAYDAGGRLAEAAYPGGTNRFAWLRDGLPARAENALGAVSFAHDGAHRLVREEGVGPASAVAYAWSPGGGLAEMASAAGVVGYARDAAGRIEEIASPQGAFCFGYDPHNGLVSSLSWQGNGVGLAVGYDLLDRETELAWRDGAGRLLRRFGYGYDEAGRVTNVADEAGGTVAYEYDGLDRLSAEVRRGPGGEAMSEQRWTYDAVGNCVARRDAGARVVCRYGPGDRLAEWTAAVTGCVLRVDVEGESSEPIEAGGRYGALWVSSGLAAVVPEVDGRRFRAEGLACGPGGQRIVAAIRDRAGNTGYATNAVIVSVVTNALYGYDAAGCVTQILYRAEGYERRLALRWDGQYRPVAAVLDGAAAEAWGYDALGRRAWIAQGGLTNRLVYSGEHVVAEVDAAGGLLRSYLWGPGVDRLLALAVHQGPGAGAYAALTDRLGTVHALVAPGGAVAESYAYDAWGRVEAFDGAGAPLAESRLGNRYLFQGREYSWPTGLYYFRARWYDPVPGRWLSPDPIGIRGGLNQYVFCNANPVMSRDPKGLYDEMVHWYMTRLWAVQEGVHPVVAKAIAVYDEGTDYNETDPIWGDRRPHFQVHEVLGKHGLQKRWRIYREAECAARSADLPLFGRKLHEFQDTYAHQGYKSGIGHGANPGSIFTLLFGGKLGPDVYDPSRGRDAAMEYNTRRLLRAWRKNNPEPR